MPVTDVVSPEPIVGRDSTGRVIVASPSLILLGVGRDSTGRLIEGLLLGVAEPTIVSHSASNVSKECIIAHMHSKAPGCRLHSKLRLRQSE